MDFPPISRVHNPSGLAAIGRRRARAGRPATREAFTGVAVPFLEEWLHAGPLPRFRAMSAALARAAAGR